MATRARRGERARIGDVRLREIGEIARAHCTGALRVREDPRQRLDPSKSIVRRRDDGEDLGVSCERAPSRIAEEACDPLRIVRFVTRGRQRTGVDVREYVEDGFGPSGCASYFDGGRLLRGA